MGERKVGVTHRGREKTGRGAGDGVVLLLFGYGFHILFDEDQTHRDAGSHPRF